MPRLVAGPSIISNAWRTLMPRLEVDPAIFGDAFRTPPAKIDLTYTSVSASPYDGGFVVAFGFPAYNVLDVVLPTKVHVCAFKPGTAVPASGAEVFALAGSAIGTTSLPGHDPIQGDDAPAQSINVSVNVTSLFAGRETTLPGVILVPVREYAD